MERLVVLLVLTALAVAAAALLQRRRPEAPTAPSYRAPSQVDRADFGGADSRQLVVVFTSATCNSCAAVWESVRPLQSDTISVQEIEIQSNPELHKRYKIDGVPTTLVIDDEGVVGTSFFGPIDSEALQAALGAS